jgi:glutathione synthase/RimK-type ligase-like ATP-grasp enzyme
MRIAIAACATNPDLSASNREYQNALAAIGADVVVLNWNSHASADFLSCDLTVLRQTWDYQADPGGFAAWLIRLHALGAKTEARPDLAIWNNDKRTLIELEQAGICIPLTYRSVEEALSKRMGSANDDGIVLKPVFGGDGNGVELTTFSDIEKALQKLQTEAPGRPVMVQEFLPEIRNGEWKMTCIEGKVELAVCAKPNEGEFRINSRFRPSISIAEPPSAARSAAEKIIAFVGAPLCARVDGVMRDDMFICTELELCDPDLHLHLAPHVAGLLAEATLQRVKQR